VKAAEPVQLCAVMDLDPCELLAKVIQSRSVQEQLTITEKLSSWALQRSAVSENVRRGKHKGKKAP